MTESPTSDYDDLLFDVRRSVRYHDRRVSFYEKFHKTVLFLALVSGSVSLAAFTAEFASDWSEWAKLLPAALISVFAGLDLVVGSSSRARLHDRLKQRFIALEGRMQREKTNDTPGKWTVERLEIEADEPPVLRVLDTLCHNEILRSMGYPPKDFIPVKPLQRFFSPFFDLDADAL